MRECPRWTPGNVKLLLSPRQSRGFTRYSLLYLPAYSSNLNLIERLWKFVTNKCLYNKFYPSFQRFKGAIKECLEKAGSSEYKEELKSLLSLRFQKFLYVLLID
jgi:hypothetical protein